MARKSHILMEVMVASYYVIAYAGVRYPGGWGAAIADSLSLDVLDMTVGILPTGCVEVLELLPNLHQPDLVALPHYVLYQLPINWCSRAVADRVTLSTRTNKMTGTKLRHAELLKKSIEQVRQQCKSCGSEISTYAKVRRIIVTVLRSLSVVSSPSSYDLII
eukprot:1191317-Prorocentrum_minimum.AAC.2